MTESSPLRQLLSALATDLDLSFSASRTEILLNAHHGSSFATHQTFQGPELSSLDCTSVARFSPVAIESKKYQVNFLRITGSGTTPHHDAGNDKNTTGQPHGAILSAMSRLSQYQPSPRQSGYGPSSVPSFNSNHVDPEDLYVRQERIGQFRRSMS